MDAFFELYKLVMESLIFSYFHSFFINLNLRLLSLV